MYLREARNFETAVIPAAESEYNYKEGRLTRKPALIEKALQGFDPLWERDMIADGFAELIKGGFQAQNFAEDLYRLNHGGLRQQGISLPVQLQLNFEDTMQPPPQGRIREMLKKAGIRTTGGNDTAPRFVLTLDFEELGGTGPMAVYCGLFDRERGTTLVSRDILLPSPSRRDCAAFARELADAVFGGN
jgi:hypothetical protein